MQNRILFAPEFKQKNSNKKAVNSINSNARLIHPTPDGYFIDRGYLPGSQPL